MQSLDMVLFATTTGALANRSQLCIPIVLFDKRQKYADSA
jgi:hypothetical protein